MVQKVVVYLVVRRWQAFSVVENHDLTFGRPVLIKIFALALGWYEAKSNCNGRLILCKEYMYLYSVLYYAAFHQGRIQKMAEYFLQGIQSNESLIYLI